jgi:hypothetical protein
LALFLSSVTFNSSYFLNLICLVISYWCETLVSHTEGITWAEGIQEFGAASDLGL